MDVSKYLTPLRLCAALVAVLAAGVPAMAGSDVGPCELKIRGHSIVRLTLVEKTRSSGTRFDRPSETVQLPAGEYRVEEVELEDGCVLNSQPGQRREWFEVAHEGPNELVVGAPLYSTVTARRHGGFIQMDYDTVDGAGRSYQNARAPAAGRSSPPTFTVYAGGEEIGSGSFEYG